MKTKLLASLILVFFLANSAFSMYGTRPMGMGGAFTAIADDANAAYWNPAGFAINPGIDLYGSLLLNNRNESVGDNVAALKMCFETELNPFLWIAGVGAVSALAYEAAKSLSDQGIVKQNWGRPDETLQKGEAVSPKVLEKGTDKTVAVGQQVKDTAKKVGKQALDTAVLAGKEAGKAVFWGPYAYPWYHYNAYRPTYWDHREESSVGKAQFAGGLTWVTDKNSTLNQNTNFYTFSLATGYQQFIALGGNINLYDLTIVPNNLKGYGAGLDLGILFRPDEKLNFGVMAKEILTTDVRFENGAMVRYAMSINAGVAVTPLQQLTLAVDAHNLFKQGNTPQTYHVGAELRPFPGLALRGGLYDNNKTAGASVMINEFILDYAYLGGTFARTQTVGLTWKI